MTGISENPETLRLQQLQLMGITSYFPRFALPGALPGEPPEALSELLEELHAVSGAESNAEYSADFHSWQAEVAYEQEARGVAAEPGKKTVWLAEPQENSPAVADRKLNQHTLAAEPALARAAITQQNSDRQEIHPESRDAGATALNLHLLLIPVDASLCVLNQIPVLANSQLHDRQLKLLENILFFLGKRTAALHSVRTFRWPLPGMSSVTSAGAAKSSLLHFLEQFFQENSFRNLLVMGDQGADWLNEAGSLPGDISASRQQWQMLQTYSLDQMLAVPGIKREVWQHLLPLQARLQRV